MAKTKILARERRIALGLDMDRKAAVIAECAKRHTPLCPLTMNIADDGMRVVAIRPRCGMPS
jgi:hypothetical protein